MDERIDTSEDLALVMRALMRIDEKLSIVIGLILGDDDGEEDEAE